MNSRDFQNWYIEFKEEEVFKNIDSDELKNNIHNALYSIFMETSETNFLKQIQKKSDYTEAEVKEKNYAEAEVKEKNYAEAEVKDNELDFREIINKRINLLISFKLNKDNNTRNTYNIIDNDIKLLICKFKIIYIIKFNMIFDYINETKKLSNPQSGGKKYKFNNVTKSKKSKKSKREKTKKITKSRKSKKSKREKQRK